jgi:outer membrane lipoprotein SlyB
MQPRETGRRRRVRRRCWAGSPAARWAAAAAKCGRLIAGAVLGGIIGQRSRRPGNRAPGVEITVQLDSGSTSPMVQEADEAFRAGDRVRVLSGRGSTRVTH